MPSRCRALPVCHSLVQDMSPDFLEALVALREEVQLNSLQSILTRCVLLPRSPLCSQHTRRLASIEGQYYGGSDANGPDDAAGAADEESQQLAHPPRAHTASAANASSGRPTSTSAAGRKADGLVRAFFRTRACSVLLNPVLLLVSCFCQSSSLRCLAAPPLLCTRPSPVTLRPRLR